MANMYPKQIDSGATMGERQVFNLLKEKLPANYYVWHNTRIGEKYPDFIIFEKNIGIIVLEVKDWKLENVEWADKKQFGLKGGTLENPIEQAREYSLLVANVLKKNNILAQETGNYRGNFVATYGHGAIFANIKKEEFSWQYQNVMEDKYTIYSDQIDKLQSGTAPMTLEERLVKMFTTSFSFRLTEEQCRAIIEGIAPMDREDQDKQKQNGYREKEDDKNIKAIKQTNRREDNKVIIGIVVGVALTIIGMAIIFPKFKVQETPVQVSNHDAVDNQEIRKEDYVVGQDIQQEIVVNEIITYKSGSIVLKIEDQKGFQEVFINKELEFNQEILKQGTRYWIEGTIQEYKDNLQINAEVLYEMVDGEKILLNRLVASQSSNKVHLQGCEWAEKIKENNRVYFETLQIAAKEGYEACEVCNPK